mmetsp:Transcript_43548/g.112817  ORF Transcript_43548/g.112817 Transcript_43548/m.112817 type:complete len:83 (-) Transcript_43548:308-556(-)
MIALSSRACLATSPYWLRDSDSQDDRGGGLLQHAFVTPRSIMAGKVSEDGLSERSRGLLLGCMSLTAFAAVPTPSAAAMVGA